MAMSRSPGNTSSNTGSEQKSLLISSLSKIASSKSITRLQKALGDEADLHLVGGCIRELAKGKQQSDIDLATRLMAEVTVDKLSKANIKVIETGISHGTVLALLDNEPIEITTFRKPSGRNTPAFGHSIEEDLQGRDFTINSLAFNLQNLELIDPFGGLEDLKNNLLRTTGDAQQRFKEDPLRILRMIRFGTADGLVVESSTLLEAEQLASSLSNISTERVKTEFEKILVSEFASKALVQMKETGILSVILPEIIPSYNFEQNQYHIHDVFEHTMWVVERSPADLRVRLACLFHDIGKPATLTVDDQGNRHFYKHELESEKICKSAMKRFKFSNSLTEDTAILVRQHMRPLTCGPSGVRRIIRDLGELFDDWLEIKKADAPPLMPADEYGQILKDFLELKQAEDSKSLQKFRSGLAIGGEDLLAIGYHKGPKMGEVLKSLEELILDRPELNNREQLLKEAQKLL